jgi:hypothetical protein
MSLKFSFRLLFIAILPLFLSVLTACGGSGGGEGSVKIDKGVFGPTVSGTPDSFRGAGIINNDNFLISGPLARGRQGDVLLQNDKIRVIIQKPTRNAGVGLFGGNIIDADRFRPSSQPGQEQFGVLYPLINLSWTANYQRLEIINGDFANGPVVLRATAALDVYDYIQTNIIIPFAQIYTGHTLNFADQFDDIFNPFKNVPSLRGINPVIVTDYTLKQDASYVIIETKFENNGDQPAKIPVGDWVNGSGNLELFVPGKGFVRKPQVDNSSCLVYQALEDDVGVSYGYFYNPIQFQKEDGTLVAAASLSVSGVTPMVLGEGGLLNIIPLSGDPNINFTVDPKSTRTITRYFVVGTGDAASVIDEGFKALGVSKLRLSGKVTDQNGSPVPRAHVLAMDGDSPVTSAFSDKDGNFAMDISTGTDAKDQLFGSGTYTVEVYKEGYVQSGSDKSGKCTGGKVDTSAKTIAGVTCKLGQSGMVNVSLNSDGKPGPGRLTIVGFDPSPTHPYIVDPNTLAFGKYHDVNLEERPYGVVDLLYIDPSGKIFPKGNPRVIGDNTIRLEPGEYEIYFTRGMEYSADHQRITVTAGGSASVSGSIKKVLDTSGYVSGDFHNHGINSPDSAYPMENRVRAAMAEGLDVFVGTDHDYVTDYQPLVQELGYENELTAFPGDEITPLAYGHMVVWPLTPDKSKADHGSYDYTFVPGDEILNPDADMVQGLDDIIEGVDKSNPGTQVFTIAHIMDKALGNFSISHLVTSPAFGVQPLSSYADPVHFRLPANTNAANNFEAPFPLGTSKMVTMNFTSVGLTISTDINPDFFTRLMETSLPTYFNLLNLGKICTALSEGDTHSQIREPVSVMKNFVESSVDPRNGTGSYSEIDPEEIATNVNAGKVIISSGVFVKAKLKSANNPQGVTVGGTIKGTGDVTLDLEITSNDYFDWDTVEVYANTEPVPANDAMTAGTDKNVEDFYTASLEHIAKYFMTPLVSFHKGDTGDTALNQTVSGGVRKAVLSKDFHFTEDTWVVVLVKGSDQVRGQFPYVTKYVKITQDAQGKQVPSSPTSPNNFLDTLDNDPVKIGGLPAFALTNPMYVDVDGDGFQSIYIRDGTSPLAK